MKILPVRAELLLVDRQVDGKTDSSGHTDRLLWGS